MHALPPLYPMERALGERLPHLRGPQRRGLALWVLGAVLAALLPWAPYHALRQRLREWLLDGADKTIPSAAQVEVDHCFAPLLGSRHRTEAGFTLSQQTLGVAEDFA